MFTTLLRKRRDRGFSFIELLAYMAIAALLILAAIPQFNAYRQKAVVSNLQNDVHNASLKVESDLIDQVAKRSGSDGGVHLAAATSTIDIAAIQADVDKMKLSPTTDKGIKVAAVDLNGYSLTAASTKTDIKAVYLSQATATMPTLKEGINLIGADDSVIGGSSGSEAGPSAPSVANLKTCVTTGPTGGISLSADGKTIYGTQDALESAKVTADCSKLTWTSVGSGSSFTATSKLWVPDSGSTVIGEQNSSKSRVVSTDGGKTATSFAPLPNFAATGDASRDGSTFWAYDGSSTISVITGVGTTNTSKTMTTVYGTSVATDADGKSAIIAHSAQGIRITHDGGATWSTPSISGSGLVTGLYMARDGQHIAVVHRDHFTSNYVVETSADGGTTWASHATPWAPTNVAMSDDGSVIVIASDSTLPSVSSDGGATWTEVAAGSRGIGQIAISSDGHIFAIHNGLGQLVISTL